MLSGNLGQIIETLSKTLDSYPRRTPGELLLEGRPFYYADLHSFYHQSMQIFAQGLYDFQSSTDTPIILDCGGHIGMAALYFARRYPKATIHSFEADPKIAELLSRNMSSFGVQNVSVHAQAVWVNNSGVTFNQADDDSGAVSAHAEKAITVPSIRLKDVLAKSQVELVKLDIEGAEFSVLHDCGDVLGNSRCYIIEVHILDKEVSLARLLLLFEENNFRYVLSDLNQAVWMTIGEKPPFKECKTDKYLVTIFAWKKS